MTERCEQRSKTARMTALRVCDALVRVAVRVGPVAALTLSTTALAQAPSPAPSIEDELVAPPSTPSPSAVAGPSPSAAAPTVDPRASAGSTPRRTRRRVLVTQPPAPPMPSPEESARAPGDGTDALPAAVTMPLAGPMRRGIAFAASGGYFLTEPVLNGTDPHHRFAGSLALAVRPLSWLAIGGRLDGRYDLHPSSTAMVPADDGLVGDPRLFVRASGAVAGGLLGLGLQASVWIPGGDAPSVAPAAITPDVDALASLRLRGAVPVTLGLLAGFRFDQSANSVTQPEQLSAADRLALGVGLGPTLKLGLGAAARVRSVELLAEWRWDLILGDPAFGALDSPMHVRLGARWHPLASRALYLGLAVDASPSTRPASLADPMRVPQPIEPRVGAFITVGVQVPLSDPRPPTPAPIETVIEEELPLDPEIAPAVETGVIEGRVLTPSGEPVADARIEVHPPNGGEVREVSTDAEGRYRIEGISPGEVELVVHARRFRETRQRVTVRAGSEPARSESRFTEALPLGQIRGLLRGFDGRPVRGTVHVEPGAIERVANADGTFELDVAPGTYQVRVSAQGFATQNRRVRVEDNGVTVLNAELRRGRGQR